MLCQNEFIKRNINVSVPISAYCKYDFIADIDGKLKKIQVKTARKRTTGFIVGGSYIKYYDALQNINLIDNLFITTDGVIESENTALNEIDVDKIC